MRPIHILGPLALLLSAAAYAAPAANLVINGDFQADADGDGWPDGWPKQEGVSVVREGGNAWILMDRYASTGQRIVVEPGWWKLRVSMRMRVTGVTIGDDGWKDARLAMSFVDQKDQHVDPWPNVFHAEGTTDWMDYSGEFIIPEAARALQFSPSLFGATGKAEFDDLRVTVSRLRSQAMDDLPPPEGARNLWNMATAWRQTSGTRERICLNDLWRFLPVIGEPGEKVPGTNQGWGWFKVPGIWPRSASGDAQEVFLSDSTDERVNLGRLDQAWYQRDLTVPAAWQGRRVLLDFAMLQTHARVFLDGEPAGEAWFPGGPLDITARVRPGQKQSLAILVTARPFERESQVFMAPDRIVTSDARVDRRGLTGDVFLVSEPAAATIDDVHVITSVREKRITLDTGLRLPGAGPFRLSAAILEGGKPIERFESAPFRAADLRLPQGPGAPVVGAGTSVGAGLQTAPQPQSAVGAGLQTAPPLPTGRFSFATAWADPKLWDLDTPGNVYDVVVTLRDAAGKVLDESLPERFGFREFRIRGRDFLLNEKPVHLRALHLTNLNSGADRASLEGSRRTLRRMQEYGFNFFITGNYHFKPGAVGYMEGMLQAADETGTLCSFSLPHVRDFRLDPAKPESAAAYRKLADYLVRRVQNHPSVVLYAMNHNATGYYGDQNPLRIDGIHSPDDKGGPGASRNRVRREALMAGDVAHALDPTRPVYHHQSGNLGEMHTVNIYLNWAPLQERSDWLEHWSTKGTKPLFFVEWGLPHISSWSSFRGPAFIWRTEAYQSIWDSEYAAAYLGQDAYRMTPTKIDSMGYEEELWSRGKPFAWSNLIRHLSRQEENYLQVQALFASDNWRAHRTWGLSAGLPWDQGGLWRATAGRRQTPVEVKERFEGLQRPGIVPDLRLPGSQYVDALEPGDVEPTSLGRAFLRWNMPLCAFVVGGPKAFTEKGHSFLPGETVRKQLVLLNDTRGDVTCAWSWTLTPGSARGQGRVTVKAGERAFVPIAAKLDAPGDFTLRARFDFGAGGTQEDSLALHVLAPAAQPEVKARIALFDPKGMTARALDGLGIRYTRVAAGADLSAYDALVIGREALTVDGPAPDLSRVREGLRVLLFEQSYDVLVSRLGFRANVQGQRVAFARVPNHPALRGLSDPNLRDWRGEATLVPPHLDITDVETADPRWNWLGFTNTRVWRCGGRGSVATVLLEKPSRGDWLPLVDCGFDLQYSPLLEYREGRGRVTFCQLDVTGRSEADPAARRLCANLLDDLASAPATLAARATLYAGDDRGADLLRRLGVRFEAYRGQALGAGSLLVVGPGAPAVPGLDAAVANGAHVLGLGLDPADVKRLIPGAAPAEQKPAVSSFLESFARPELAGLSNAELHWRTKPAVAALENGPGEGSAALRVIEQGKGRIVLSQAAPWAFDYAAKPYLRTTWRRSAFLAARLLANLGAEAQAPLLGRFGDTSEVFDFPLPAAWKGLVDKEETGERLGWSRPDFDDSGWKPIAVPGTFEQQIPELANYDGVFWYRIRFRAPKGLSPDGLKLDLGAIDDESWVWLNGKLLGEVTKQTNPEDYYRFPRVYPMQPGMLNAGGENVLVVRVRDTFQSGGILGVPRLSAKGPWLRTYYLQEPESVDDPYRYYRW